MGSIAVQLTSCFPFVELEIYLLVWSYPKPVKQEVSRTIILPPTVSVFWPRRRATFYCHYVFCMGVETSARIIPFLPDVLGATREVELRRVRGFAWELLCLWRTLPTRRCSKMQTKISPGVVVMGGDSCSRGCGFEFQHPTLDGHFSHWFVVKIVIFVWKHENKTKKSRGWPILKKIHRMPHFANCWFCAKLWIKGYVWLG